MLSNSCCPCCDCEVSRGIYYGPQKNDLPLEILKTLLFFAIFFGGHNNLIKKGNKLRIVSLFFTHISLFFLPFFLFLSSLFYIFLFSRYSLKILSRFFSFFLVKTPPSPLRESGRGNRPEYISLEVSRYHLYNLLSMAGSTLLHAQKNTSQLQLITRFEV